MKELIIDGRRFTPKAIEEVDGGYIIGDKFIASQSELFRYDMSADIRAEEAAAEAAVQRLMLGSASDSERLADGFDSLNYDD